MRQLLKALIHFQHGDDPRVYMHRQCWLGGRFLNWTAKIYAKL